MKHRYLSVMTLSLLLSQGAALGAEKNPTPPTSGEYLLFGKSMFDFTAGTNAYLSGGVPLSYPVIVTLDDTEGKATIDGLLGTREPYEAVTGTYNLTNRNIHFITPPEVLRTPENYISLKSSNADYYSLLCALKPYGIGYIDALEGLTFTFSDDGRTIYPSSGFGAGAAYNINGEMYSLADYMEMIYDAVLVKKESGISFNIDRRKVDITNAYPGMVVNSTFRIYNTGEEASDYVVSSSSTMFTVSNPAGMLAPGEFIDIDVRFVADEVGEYTSRVTVTNEERDITFDVRGVCNYLPEYYRIVKEGSFDFSTDPEYPWLLSDKYSDTPVAVCTNTGNEMTESSLYADVVISEQHEGILSWTGYCDPYHPLRDGFGVLIDGVEQYVSPDGGGVTTSQIHIAPGMHRVKFTYVKGPIVNGSFPMGEDYAWIKDLSLVERKLDANSFISSADRVNFSPRTIVRDKATDTYEVYFKNQGYDDLVFIDAISDSDAFSAEIPSEPISTFDVDVVKILFHTSEPGKHSGRILLRTNAGDYEITCNGEAVAVPDFSPIVSKGEFYFDTTIGYPFTIENGKAYNSTSQKKDRRSSSSALVAYFDVPEGYYGELSWKARVSTADIHNQEMTDYASVLIDGEEIKQDYTGEKNSSHTDFAPAAVNFYPGEHFVVFSYNQAGDGKFEGDDRIEISDLSLELKKMKENDVMIWGSDEALFEDVRITKAYQREVKLVNMGSNSLQIKNVRCGDDFIVEIDPTRYYNTFEEIPVTVTFIPEKAGTMEDKVVLETSAGEVDFNCRAIVIDDPNTLLIEDFEDDMRLWRFIDGDGDNDSWVMVSMVNNAYHGEGAIQSFSIHSDFTEGPIDDIALSPEFSVPAEGAELSFYLACYNPSVADSLDILVGEGDDYKTFDTFDIFNLQDAPAYYNKYVCLLDDYAGKTVRIAFRHALEKSVMSFIAIDDVLVTAGRSGLESAVAAGREVAATEYFNLQGMKVENPAEGLYIRLVRYTDGSETSEKVYLGK